MRRYISILIVAVFMGLSAGGCQPKDMQEMVNEHVAMKMYRDGVWDTRYMEWNCSYGFGKDGIEEERLVITIDVKKDMTEEQMLQVLDFCEFVKNAAPSDDGSYQGERDTDFICHAIFYQGGSDQELRRIKYVNGEEAEIGRDDSSIFPFPDWRTPEKDRTEGYPL